MLVEPPPSPGDLHFRLFGVPVRVHPFFWLMTLLLGMRSEDPQELLLWVIAVFVSIMVHEFGHVLAYHAYSMRGRIVLYAFGGLAISDEFGSARPWGYGFRRQDGWPQVVISLAGPAAGFLLAGLIVAVLGAAGAEIPLYWLPDPLLESLAPLLVGKPIENPSLSGFVFDLLYVNVLWGLLNLLPIYPLDGGQAARELLQLAGSADAVRVSLVLSLATAVTLAVAMLVKQEPLFNVFFFGFLAFDNFRLLSALSGRGGWPF
jgi:Zn-dependent protease